MNDEEYLKAIAKADEDLTSLVDRIKNKKYQDNDTLWVGADIAIDEKAPPKSTDWWPPQDDYVVTPFCLELSWLFMELRDIFFDASLIDFSNKIEFFGCLADAAIRYMSTVDDGIGNTEDLLMSTHKEAKSILKEMLSSYKHGE